MLEVRWELEIKLHACQSEVMVVKHKVVGPAQQKFYEEMQALQDKHARDVRAVNSLLEVAHRVVEEEKNKNKGWFW